MIIQKQLIYKSQNLEWYRDIIIDPQKIKEDEMIEWWCDFLIKFIFGFIFIIFFSCVIFIFSI